MRMSRIGFSLAMFSATTLLIPLLAVAQTFGSTNPFTISVSPQYPRPHEQLVLTFTSGAIDLTNATVAVVVNNTQVYKGNAQPLPVVLGATGTLTTIKVTATSNGKDYLQTLSVRPQDVVLVAEPVSSAPVLYAGKPLVPLGGSVRVVAVADLKTVDGKTIVPSALAYEWAVDETKIASASGIGKDTIVVASPLQYRERSVAVTVRSQDESVGSGASLSLSPQEPTVRIYRNDSLLGIMYDHALASSYTISTPEASFFGAPYSFPAATGAPLLQWFLNGSAAQTGSSITLRPTGTGKGSASLSVTASAGDSSTATANVSLSFGVSVSRNFFGL